jgi:hypothetical protein
MGEFWIAMGWVKLIWLGWGSVVEYIADFLFHTWEGQQIDAGFYRGQSGGRVLDPLAPSDEQGFLRILPERRPWDGSF